MAKYLQDIYINFPYPPKSFSNKEIEDFRIDNKELWSSLKLIEDLYNFNFPKKYITHDNLWRLDIYFFTDKKSEHLEEGMESTHYVDIEILRKKDETGRKEYLFEKVSNQLINYLKNSGYSTVEFEKLNSHIYKSGIKFNEPYRKEKLSPDKKHKAFIWAKYDEFEKGTYIKIIDKNGNTILYEKVDNQHFSNFKCLKWQDNLTINIFEINTYSIPKQFSDYYEVSLNGSTIYRPVTREANFQYGLKLLVNSDTFEQGLKYIVIAAKLNHGKAVNVLENLKRDPEERNLKRLLKENKK